MLKNIICKNPNPNIALEIIHKTHKTIVDSYKPIFCVLLSLFDLTIENWKVKWLNNRDEVLQTAESADFINMRYSAINVKTVILAS